MPNLDETGDTVSLRVKPHCYFPPRPLALAKPLPLIPRPLPRAAPPLVLVVFPMPPRLFIPELGRDADVGAPNLDDIREEVGRLETNEVSVVLESVSSDVASTVL